MTQAKKDSLACLLSQVSAENNRKRKYALFTEKLKAERVRTTNTTRAEGKKLNAIGKLTDSDNYLHTRFIMKPYKLCIPELNEEQDKLLYEVLLSFPPKESILACFQNYMKQTKTFIQCSLLKICLRFHVEKASIHSLLCLECFLKTSENDQEGLQTTVVDVVNQILDRWIVLDINDTGSYGSSDLHKNILCSLGSFVVLFDKYFSLKILLRLLFLGVGSEDTFAFMRIIQAMDKESNHESLYTELLAVSKGRWNCKDFCFQYLFFAECIQNKQARGTFLELYREQKFRGEVSCLTFVKRLSKEFNKQSNAWNLLELLFYFKIRLSNGFFSKKKYSEAYDLLNDIYKKCHYQMSSFSGNDCTFPCAIIIQHCFDILQPLLPRNNVLDSCSRRQSHLSDYGYR